MKIKYEQDMVADFGWLDDSLAKRRQKQNKKQNAVKRNKLSATKRVKEVGECSM